jgi:hypothetical protein
VREKLQFGLEVAKLIVRRLDWMRGEKGRRSGVTPYFFYVSSLFRKNFLNRFILNLSLKYRL